MKPSKWGNPVPILHTAAPPSRKIQKYSHLTASPLKKPSAVTYVPTPGIPVFQYPQRVDWQRWLSVAGDGEPLLLARGMTPEATAAPVSLDEQMKHAALSLKKGHGVPPVIQKVREVER